MQIDPLSIKGLPKSQQQLAADISRGRLDGGNFCYCERCKEIHVYTQWNGKRVMIGKCGAFIESSEKRHEKKDQT
jgi:hypothetical protein